MTSLRTLPMRLKFIWHLLLPEPGELCSGFGLMLLALLSQLDRHVSFTLAGRVQMMLIFGLGLTLFLASLLSASHKKRGDLAGGCGLLWLYLTGCTVYSYGLGARQGPLIAFAFLSFLTALRDWDEE